jgi:hypothetical protein
MRTTQGQAAFGHKVQAIITYSDMVKTFYEGTVGRVCSMRLERTYIKVQTTTNRFVMNYLHLQFIPAKLSRSAKQHPSKSAHLVRRFVRGLSIHVYQFFIPTDFVPSLIPDACHAWGGCGWLKHQPRHSKHHRQRDASLLTAKLDLAPPRSQSPSHVYSVQCLSKPASCEFLLACFPQPSPVPTARTSVLYFHTREPNLAH